MKTLAYIGYLIVFAGLLQSCTTTRRFGTTIERDEKNPCQINMIIQVAIQGTDDDVTMVKNDLENCFSKECFIPCPNDSTKGCLTKISVVVKKYASLSEEEARGYHYVNMLDNDGLPSRAQIGTPNGKPVEGWWRRNEPPGTYCHEVLHFCGLRDKYCARLLDPVTGTMTTERICDPPPEPGAGSCCIPWPGNTRCTVPCEGHEHDMMGASGAQISCENILDVVSSAGLNNCPPECCGSNMTFTRPAAEIFITPGYFHFGDKNTKFGSFGLGLGYTKFVSPSIGITIEGGYYKHTDKQDDLKQNSDLLNLTGGLTYRLGEGRGPSRISFTAHALVGISKYVQKTSFAGNSSKTDETSLHFNVGAAMNLRLSRSWTLRVMQADYAPTFFYDATQNNYRLGAGNCL